MNDDIPPPLPPKQRGGNNGASNNNYSTGRYSSDITALAVQEEATELERMKQLKDKQKQPPHNRQNGARSLNVSPSLIPKNADGASASSRSSPVLQEDLIKFENHNKKTQDILELYRNSNTTLTSYPNQNVSSCMVPFNRYVGGSTVAPLGVLSTRPIVSTHNHPTMFQNVPYPNRFNQLSYNNPVQWETPAGIRSSASAPLLDNFKSNNSFYSYTPNIPLCTPTTKPALEVRSNSVSTTGCHSASVAQTSGSKRFFSQQEAPAPGGSDDLIDFGPTSNFKGCNDNINSALSLLDVDTLLSDFDPLSVRPKETPLNHSSVSVASSFRSQLNDPPLSSEASAMLDIKEKSRASTYEASSYYEQVDPFEYMRSTESVKSDPIIDAYDGLRSPTSVSGDTFDSPPPLPVRNLPTPDGGVKLRRTSSSKAKSSQQKRENTVLDGKYSTGVISIQKSDTLRVDNEAVEFWNAVKEIRETYKYDDGIGNPGLLHCSCLDHLVHGNLSVKLQIFYESKEPVHFTSNLNASVEHIILQALVSLEIEDTDCSQFFLKVRGIDEYLWGSTALGESMYVQSCVKYDNDVMFTLVQEALVKRPYIRTAEDDERLERITVSSLLSAGVSESLHYHRLAIAIQLFEKELQKLQNSAFLLLNGTPLQDLPCPVRSSSLIQVVKQICAVAGDIVTLDILEAVDCLVETCRTIQKSQGILDGEEASPHQKLSSCGGSMVTSGNDYNVEHMKAQLMNATSKLSGALTSFLQMYGRAFRVDFTVAPAVDQQNQSITSNQVYDKMSVQVRALHRLSSNWRYDQYFVEAQLYHGSRCVGTAEPSRIAKPRVVLRSYSFVPFDVKLDLGARISILPLESRVMLTVFGLRLVAQSDASNETPKYIREEVGWTALQCFSFDSKLIQGGHLLTLWPSDTDRRLPPAPHSSDHPQANSCPLLDVEFPDYSGDVVFPKIVPHSARLLDFNDLDINTQQQLKDIVERDIFTFNKSSVEEREVLWEKRHYLHHEPHALAKVLLAAHSWDQSCLPDLHSMVLNWSPPAAPPDALHLLLPSFGDTVVRTKAVEWLRGLGSDQLLSYLPQLVQALKHESWDNNAVSRMLLERAITCPRLAHHLYWLLNMCIPQQTSMSGERDIVQDCRYRRRLMLVTRALLVICGSNLENRLLVQEALLRTLYETAMHIKDVKDSQRMKVMSERMENLNDTLKACQTSLPLSPALVVSGVEVRSCAYFNSFTLPLKLVFHSSEPNTNHINAIFKVGDDLRQDMLVIQMIRLMDKLWLEAGLDLKIVTFNVVPTGDKIGIIELVKEAETLRKIQTEYGVTGVFKDRPIAEWLAKQNPSALEYRRAVENFTASCAGYCVATYILGICDRHNDNIMLKTTGHLFHIDFGKFLGDAQKFGNFKRDRTPFVLTADMAFVINGGEKASDKFHYFVDLCCQAFNIIRANGHLLLYLFALMASSGINGVSWNAVMFVQKALLQDYSSQEAGAFFARMIKDSLSSKFTQVNFFIHNLAQLRFQNDATDNDGLLLSFIPRTYTMQDDGRVQAISVYSYQKRYSPNKFYVYILRVDRVEQREPCYLFRSYKEFSEFHQKLCLSFPLAPFHSLPRGVQMGRSEVSSVAERRKLDIELFLGTLMSCEERIAHSDIVYTFLHPLLRDQEDADIHITKLKKANESNQSSRRQVNAIGGLGQVRVSLHYARGQLVIMVEHARNLTMPGGTEPSPYAKLYLLPDPNKKTKRKTRVVKKSCHPSFMEQIIYRMFLEHVQEKTLEISIWSEDKFSENSYLGSCYLPLADIKQGVKISEWLSLEHKIRTARRHDLL